MVYATSDGKKAERLRVGMVGGGRNAFIGAVHRFAIRLDDQIVLVAGALSSDPDNAAASAAEIGIAPDLLGHADQPDPAHRPVHRSRNRVRLQPGPGRDPSGDRGWSRLPLQPEQRQPAGHRRSACVRRR